MSTRRVSLYQRIYRLRIALGAVLLLAIGLVWFLLTTGDKSKDLALLVAGTGGLGLIIEGINRVLAGLLIGESIVENLAADNPRILEHLSPETRERAAINIIASDVGDRDRARDAYELATALASLPGARYDETVTISLNPREAASGDTQYLFAVVRCEHRTTLPLGEVTFLATRDPFRYRDALSDPFTADPWLFDDPALDIPDDAYQLLSYAIDGEPQAIRTDRDDDTIYYRVNRRKPKRARKNTPCMVSYEYRAIVPVGAHHLWYDITRPTRDLTITINQQYRPIQRLTPRANFIGAQPSITSTTTDSATPATITAHGWVYLGSSVNLVWTLE
ncbi:hypothetical protein [Amycolatopsis sp. WAC 04197]|uniref:hypothetical protein n=1 Tax=Amycolatopsis sp. WAC 04197 TaxID=2203199 RepID=UPI000F77C470|nr:hypothetical protein [Amycolatopsis sp. WAC 04197]